MTNKSKKRGRKSKDPDLPPRKLEKPVVIRDVKDTSGSSEVTKQDSVVPSYKGKGKEPMTAEKKKRKPRSTTPKNKSGCPAAVGRVVVSKRKRKVEEEEGEVKDLEIPEGELEEDVNEEEIESEDELVGKIERKIAKKGSSKSVCRLIGPPVPSDEARRQWPNRYLVNEGDEDHVRAARHYYNAEVDGVIYEINDCCLIQAAKGEEDYLGRIVEFFETAKNKAYICVKWFFRGADTAIHRAHPDLIEAGQMDPKLVFASNSSDVNPLDCIVSKITVVQSPSASQVLECDFFYEMSYMEELCTFENVPTGDAQDAIKRSSKMVDKDCGSEVLTLLDLYAGCGGMSTGLCMGSAANNVKLVARWAVDYNEDACLSLGHNHPETEVRNEKAEDFLQLLKEWEKLCGSFSLLGTEFSKTKMTVESGEDCVADDPQRCPPDDQGEYEVEKIIDICYGDPNWTGKPKELYYKVVWKGWGSDHDTWEPASGLQKCEESIEDFIKQGYQSHILPLPGSVDVICGGPPCQGISGYNRFRDAARPLNDEKNYQLIVFMDIIKFLRPKFVLMENVVDILKFSKGYLGRYAMGRLAAMQYQTRLGLLVAGSYGLPQYRQRAFLWGAQLTETLPQFPVPTHKVISRGATPKEFEKNLVLGDDTKLLKALVLEDAISDLPKIKTDETRDEMEYDEGPKTSFQRKIRLPKHVLMGSVPPKSVQSMIPKLYDHRPLKLSDDDNLRVRMIPQRKGANFRDLPGVIVDENNKAMIDPNVERDYIRPGTPLVPEYAIKFVKGKSKKPFGRLWDDEVVNTVVTRAEPHNQAILHPHQNRVMSIRENARLQGFPDFYQLFGTVKQRYMQVGNAVAVPVSKALGFCLANAVQGISDGGQIVELPPSFSS
ncbi:hypothetical protein MKW94_010531 [Papaver nudicaule]|uniref:Cytosine-specific methyltransferase n=1 Tax=Papaver nudicaule TaxID=74823 RepID=A0AA41SAH9_PAPNU|nr:hypothetical protein [Papaver nudicaule]